MEREAESGQGSNTAKLYLYSFYGTRGGERPGVEHRKTLPPPVRFSEEFGGLNAFMNSLLSPRTRNDTTVVADSI